MAGVNKYGPGGCCGCDDGGGTNPPGAQYTITVLFRSTRSDPVWTLNTYIQFNNGPWNPITFSTPPDGPDAYPDAFQRSITTNAASGTITIPYAQMYYRGADPSQKNTPVTFNYTYQAGNQTFIYYIP